MATGIKDKVAIIGMGCTRFGERWDMGAEELMVEASDRAGLMVQAHRDALLEIADGLCSRDELEGDTIREIVARHADITERRGPVRISSDRK